MTIISFNVSDLPTATLNGRIRLFPDSVIRLAPSSVVGIAPITFGWVSVMVMGSVPQSKVTMPPAASPTSNAPSVQLAAVPVPTVASARARAEPPRSRVTTASAARLPRRIMPMGGRTARP